MGLQASGDMDTAPPIGGTEPWAFEPLGDVDAAPAWGG